MPENGQKYISFLIIYIIIWTVINLLFLASFPFMHTDEEAWLGSLTRTMMSAQNPAATRIILEPCSALAPCNKDILSQHSGDIYRHLRLRPVQRQAVFTPRRKRKSACFQRRFKKARAQPPSRRNPSLFTGTVHLRVTLCPPGDSDSPADCSCRCTFFTERKPDSGGD